MLFTHFIANELQFTYLRIKHNTNQMPANKLQCMI